MSPRRLSAASVTVLVAVTAALPSPASAADRAAEGTDRYLVAFEPGVHPVAGALAMRADGAEVVHVFRHAFTGGAFDLTDAEAAELADDPLVRRLEKDMPVRIAVTRTGPPWGLDRIDQRGLPLSRTASRPEPAGAGVRVYVLDTGVRATHAEFAGRMLPGVNALGDGRGTDDCNGHGTHVAGIAAGATWGVAPRASIVPVRVLGCDGFGSWSSVIAGLDWVAANNHGAPAVANLSLGGPASVFIDAAVERLHRAGVLVTVAAGNASTDACSFSPARSGAALTIGASAANDAKASFSNFGPCVDLFAPGVAVIAAGRTSDTASAQLSGTSMAAPHAAGAAALLLAQRRAATPTQIAALLTGSATPGVVSSAGPGSPDRLLFADPSPLPVLAPPVVSTAALPAATLGSPYAATLTAAGGTAPYRWTVSGLPAGLHADGSGQLTGRPTGAGSFPVTATVTDAAGVQGSAQLTVTVAGPLSAPAAGLPAAVVAAPFNATLSASGGSAPFTWALGSGSLPPGVDLAADGTLAGRPTAAGSFPFTVTVTDAAGAQASSAFTVDVAPAPPAAFRKAAPSGAAFAAPSKVRLSWFGSVGATSYEVCVSRTAACDAGSSGWMRVGSARTVHLAALSPATRFFWQVRAVNVSGSVDANAGVWWRFTTTSR